MNKKSSFKFERNVVRKGGISALYQIGNSHYFVKRYWPVIQSDRGILIIDIEFENHSFCENMEL